jgi:hypothetical protein
VWIVYKQRAEGDDQLHLVGLDDLHQRGHVSLPAQMRLDAVEDDEVLAGHLVGIEGVVRPIDSALLALPAHRGA